MKSALILIAFALAIIVGTAAEAVETHQAVLRHHQLLDGFLAGH